jgi:repressor LexA
VFALRVTGDSMIGDGILDGDYIFVRKQLQASSGEIVVAMIEDEATVKRFYPEGDRIRFQPSNPRLKPIYVNRDEFRETQIIGVVVGVYRKMQS